MRVDRSSGERVPPGQRLVRGWPISHYGPVPRFRPTRWDFRVSGATADGRERRWDEPRLEGLERVTVVADLHCASGPTSTGHEWYGVPGAALVDCAAPRPDVSHVMVWGEYGYSANLRLSDLTAPETVLATHHNGEALTAEHGFPLRLVVPHLYGYKSVKWLRGIEYLADGDRLGFWESRGYHPVGEAWSGLRYAHDDRQEEPAAADV